MILQIIPAAGVGSGKPIVLDASQVVIRQDNGTVMALAMHYGPDGSYVIGIAGDDEFDRLLAAAGIHEEVICDRLQLPKPPPGAVLVADPRRKRT